MDTRQMHDALHAGPENPAVLRDATCWALTNSTSAGDLATAQVMATLYAGDQLARVADQLRQAGATGQGYLVVRADAR